VFLTFIAVMTKSSVVKIDPEIMSGTPCFAGTRVPASILFDYLKGGNSLNEFLSQYPSVPREQAIACLREARERIIASLQTPT